MEELVYLNGTIRPRSEAKIPVMDYGFLYGYGLFETMRAYEGSVFRLDAHVARLKQSADILRIHVDTAVLKKAVTDTIAANRLKDARVRLTVSAGSGSAVPDPGTCTRPTVLVVVMQYIPYPQAICERGFKATTSSIRRNSGSPVPGMKTLNYMESLLSRQEAKIAGVDDAILLNERGFLAEATASNLFMVSKNILKTPKLESGILPGITREVILELAPKMGIKAIEGDLELKELLNADEAFLTNSIMEIMPLVEINGKPVGSGKPGGMTGRLMQAYKEMMLKETSHS